MLDIILRSCNLVWAVLARSGSPKASSTCLVNSSKVVIVKSGGRGCMSGGSSNGSNYQSRTWVRSREDLASTYVLRPLALSVLGFRRMRSEFMEVARGRLNQYLN